MAIEEFTHFYSANLLSFLLILSGEMLHKSSLSSHPYRRRQMADLFNDEIIILIVLL